MVGKASEEHEWGCWAHPFVFLVLGLLSFMQEERGVDTQLPGLVTGYWLLVTGLIITKSSQP